MTQRPEVLDGTTTKRKTKCGNMYIIMNYKDGKLDEVFFKVKKAPCGKGWTEFAGKLITYHLRNGYSIQRIMKQLDGIVCVEGLYGDQPGCQQVIHDVLKEYMEKQKEEESDKDKSGK